MLHYVLGITKAYSTRVGGGPFPTELDRQTPGTVGQHLSTVGAGSACTSPGRRAAAAGSTPRCSSARSRSTASPACASPSSTCSTASTRLQACTGYKLDGEHVDILPVGADEIARCEPVYETLQGWSESTVGVTQYDKLPVNARCTSQRIEQVTGVPIDMVSTSPDRDHTIMMRHPYLAE